MEIKDMKMSDIELRMSEIREEMESENANLDALTEEVRQLKERRAELEAEAEKREKLLNDVSETGTTIRTFKPEKEERFDNKSPEFASAWWKMMARDSRGNFMFGEPTDVEKRAFTFVTTNTPEVVPQEILDYIVELIDNDSPMYDDSAKSNMRFGFAIPRLKSITAGDAKVVTEGTANDDEQDDFDSIDLVGVEIKKHIVMSRKMEFQSIDAFRNWVLTHIAARIRVAKETYILGQLAKSSTVGIATTNILTAASLTDAEMRKCLGLLRGSGTRVLYANSDFIWNTIAGLENESGEKLFIPSPMSDPLVEGRIYGTLVKRDSNIPDDTFYVGYPNKILSNEFVLFDITPQIEDKTLNRIFVGYSLFDAGLEDPEAFVKWSVGE